MQSWKKTIFINAIRIKLRSGEETLEEILSGYPKLTDEEKEVLRKNFQNN